MAMYTADKHALEQQFSGGDLPGRKRRFDRLGPS
jgi:hypothetical protein